MAINRYTTISPLEHTGSFFELPVEALANTLQLKQQAYDTAQASLDTYLAEAAKMQYLPVDQQEASKRKELLLDQEKAMRQRVGGDLAAAEYQDGLRDLLRKDIMDPFYKDASFMYDQTVNRYQPAYQEFISKQGVAPESWQDPFGNFVRSYRGAHMDKPGVFSGIDANIPFQPTIIDQYVKPWLDKEFANQKLESRTINGIPTIVHTEKGEVTATTLRELLGSAGIEGSAVYNQLKRKFDSVPELKNSYPSFEEYYNEQLDNIAKSMAISYYKEKLEWTPPPSYFGEGGTSARSAVTTAADEQELEEIETEIKSGVAMENIPGAASAFGFPTRELMVKKRALSQRMLTQFWDGGGQNAQGITVPSLTRRLESALGITQEDIAAGTSLSVLQNGENNEIAATLSYTSKDGYARTVDLINPAEAIIRAEEMPDNVRSKLSDALLYIQQQNTEYTNIKAEISQLENFDRDMMTRYFGKDAWRNVTSRGWHTVVSDPNYRNSPHYNKDRDTRFTNFLSDQSSDADYLNTLQRNYSGLTGEAKRNEMIYLLENVMGKQVPPILKEEGAPINYQLNELNRLLKTSTYGARAGTDQTATETRQKWTDRLRSTLAYEYLTKSNDPKMKMYTQTFQDHWQKGIDANGNPLSGIGSTSGIRQTNRIIYDFNLANSTGSESSELFRTNTRRLLGSLLSTGVSGSGVDILNTGQKNTNSLIPVYRWMSDELATSEELASLGKIDEDGNFAGFDLVGFSTDSQGIVMVIQGKNVDGGKQGQNGLYEVRNQTQIFDMMDKAGFQSKAVLMTTHNFLKSFQDETEEYTNGTQKPGQHRTKQTGIIDVGGYARPVEMLMRNQVIDGQEYKEGTFRYFSQSRKEYVYATDPLQVTLEAMVDRRNTFEGPQGYSAVNKETYQNIQVNEEVFKNGGNVFSNQLLQVLDHINKTSTVKQTLTSGYRDADHQLSRANPTSAHIQMDAADFSARGVDGDIDPAKVAYFYEVYQKYRPLGFQVILEVPPSQAAGVADLKAKYGADFVNTSIEHGTGAHFHIQYSRELAARLRGDK